MECSPCLRGHYCSNETTSEEAMLSVMVCPPGFLCSQGLARDPQRSATLCPRGFYCPGGGIVRQRMTHTQTYTYIQFTTLIWTAECLKRFQSIEHPLRVICHRIPIPFLAPMVHTVNFQDCVTAVIVSSVLRGSIATPSSLRSSPLSGLYDPE